MENKYYIPDINDLFEGYECEKIFFCEFDTHYNCPNYESWVELYTSDKINSYPYIMTNDDLFKAHQLGNFRTKYLDREDIESLDWEFDINGEDVDDIYIYLCNRRCIYFRI